LFVYLYLLFFLPTVASVFVSNCSFSPAISLIFIYFQRVGCDLKIGSTKKIDGCGVCGGDGNSCSQPLYYWEMAPMSQCSVTCGGGKSFWVLTVLLSSYVCTYVVVSHEFLPSL